MNKPTGYDEAKVGGSFEPVMLGGHTCTIKQVSETKSKSGADMIVVLFDFDANDEQNGYFKSSFDADERQEKKWPFNGTSWIMVNDYQDHNKTSRNFKTFCSMVEKSNKGFQIHWGDNWGAQFKGKKIGAVYGNEEDEYNGEYRMRPRLKWFCGYDEAKTAKIPEPKYLKNKPAGAVSTEPQPVEDDDIPF